MCYPSVSALPGFHPHVPFLILECGPTVTRREREGQDLRMVEQVGRNTVPDTRR